MRIFIVLVLLILTVSCSNDKNVDTNVCTTTGSIDDVPWIAGLKKSMTNCSCESSIIKGRYDNQTVIFIALTDPLCDGIDTPTLYNCEGIEIRSFTNSAADQKELFDKVTRDSVLYRCKS
jgi:hypothetical protein